jgi:hypothetical protein
MSRYKSHKQAFIMTALVILLCLVCLTGATLALFTSDVNDGTIGIVTTAGDVKVDIVDAKTGESLVGKVLQFQTTSDQKDILFEPGATFFTQGFKVENTGNIPVNFRVYISEDEEKHEEEDSLFSKNYEKLDMEAFHKAFDVWITTDPNDPNQNIDVAEFRGKLAPAEEGGRSVTSDTYYLVIRMKPDADNKFQNKFYSGIGITVYAAQGNAELWGND